jgi:hypothetical protein
MPPIRGRRGNVSFGPSHREFDNRIERGIDIDQLLNIERGVSGNETSNVEEGVRGESRALNGGED